jgi:hypothetical protein
MSRTDVVAPGTVAAGRAREDSQSTAIVAPTRFTGTDNPRHLRVIHALQRRPMPREQLDQVAGASNGPDLIAELRRRGLEVPCTRTKKQDRDLFDIWPGVYCLSQRDRRNIGTWLRKRENGGDPGNERADALATAGRAGVIRLGEVTE